jgi:hypothetical protein
MGALPPGSCFEGYRGGLRGNKGFLTRPIYPSFHTLFHTPFHTLALSLAYSLHSPSLVRQG